MAVPRDLEDAIVDAAAAEISDEDVDTSPYGPLFELAVFMAHDYHGYGTFATAYDDVVVVLPRPSRGVRRRRARDVPRDLRVPTARSGRRRPEHMTDGSKRAPLWLEIINPGAHYLPKPAILAYNVSNLLD